MDNRWEFHAVDLLRIADSYNSFAWDLPKPLIDGYALMPVTKLGVTKYQFLGACYLRNVKERYSGSKRTSNFTFPLYDKDERTLAILLLYGRSRMEKWGHYGEGQGVQG